jgi:wyosine [tRNA(Phe)-imidazoG37] synthetase (radical SAM superfamily)
MLSFGPVPSRRLGHSLGINNIPHKICSYSCVYCQVGRTRDFRIEPAAFYEPEQVVREVRERTTRLWEMGESIDYLTFVPDGEPTLDLNLAATIRLLKPIGFRIAVITNGSLLGREEVRAALLQADWVSCKLDSVTRETWRRINRPHAKLRLQALLEGLQEFRSSYPGTLVTETMLVEGLNDENENLKAVAAFLERLQPEKAYLSIPTRPPAESWVRPPAEEALVRAHEILGRAVPQVEHLIGYEGNAFASTGDAEQDLLSITAVHPMRKEAVSELLGKAGGDWSLVLGLVDRGLLVWTEYQKRIYYLRKFPNSGAGR